MVHSGLMPELERNVFELAALDQLRSIPILIRVAWRVKQWLEPLLYRTLVIDGIPIDGLPYCNMDTFMRIVKMKSPDFLANAVRNVMVRSAEDDHLQTIFSACPGIQNLYFSGSSPAVRAALDILPLRHLYCRLRGVFTLGANDTCTRPIFAHLTHLQLFNNRRDPVDNGRLVSMLAQIPNLSHLAMEAVDYPAVYNYQQILEACTHLRVLVRVAADEQMCRTEQASGLTDVRFVTMLVYVSDNKVEWGRRILAGDDFWARAEGIIARRPRKKSGR